MNRDILNKARSVQDSLLSITGEHRGGVYSLNNGTQCCGIIKIACEKRDEYKVLFSTTSNKQINVPVFIDCESLTIQKLIDHFAAFQVVMVEASLTLIHKTEKGAFRVLIAQNLCKTFIKELEKELKAVEN